MVICFQFRVETNAYKLRRFLKTPNQIISAFILDSNYLALNHTQGENEIIKIRGEAKICYERGPDDRSESVSIFFIGSSNT